MVLSVDTYLWIQQGYVTSQIYKILHNLPLSDTLKFRVINFIHIIYDWFQNSL